MRTPEPELTPDPVLIANPAPCTVWIRLNRDQGKQRWEFNHLEAGHANTGHPKVLHPSQEGWKRGQWRKEHAWLVHQGPERPWRLERATPGTVDGPVPEPRDNNAA